MKRPTDTEMLDWLSRQEYVSFHRHYNPMVAERNERERRTGGYNGHVDFFSTRSQHLNDVATLRDAVRKAMVRRRKKANRIKLATSLE